MTNASGTAGRNTASSWRKAASLRSAKRKPFQLLMTARSNLSMGSICGLVGELLLMIG